MMGLFIGLLIIAIVVLGVYNASLTLEVEALRNSRDEQDEALLEAEDIIEDLNKEITILKTLQQKES